MSTAGTPSEFTAETVPQRPAPFRVLLRVTRRTIGQVIAAGLMVAASAGFVGGAVAREAAAGPIIFFVLGSIGILVFGGGVMLAAGGVLSRRPVLELTPEGVRRPAAWPRSRRGDRTLPWGEIAGVCVLSRGLPAGRHEQQHYLIFLPTVELAELARTAPKPELVALTLPDVPAGAAVAPWRFIVDPSWNRPLPAVLAEVGRLGDVEVIDRRKR